MSVNEVFTGRLRNRMSQPNQYLWTRRHVYKCQGRYTFRDTGNFKSNGHPLWSQATQMREVLLYTCIAFYICICASSENISLNMFMASQRYICKLYVQRMNSNCWTYVHRIFI